MGDFGPGLSPTETPLPDVPADPTATAEDINVLVTGFGPFKNQPINPSFLIASSLPPTLTLPNSAHRIRIYIHPSPIRVSYAAVQHVVPGLITAFERSHGGRAPDIVLHIGMASVRRYYAAETRAHRDGYAMTDVDGQTGFEYGEVLWKKMGLPPMLEPGLQERDQSSAPPSTFTTTTTAPSTTATTTTVTETEMITQPPLPSPGASVPASVTLSAPKPRTRPRPLDDHLLQTWGSHLPATESADAGFDIRLSSDPGRYLCEFIYYTSMAHAVRSGRDRSVVFLHVPGWTDEKSVEKGRDVTIALVKALVGCWVDC